jgi:hypothetical protein
VAEGSGNVLFGRDDQSTGAVLDETGGSDGIASEEFENA